MPTLRTRATARFCAFAVPAVLAAASFSTRAAAEEPPKPAPASAEKPALIPAEAAPGVDPAKDKASLEKQGDARPKADGSTADPTSGPVYSDSWWSNTRPVIEIHGFFRTRGEIFHNFSLGRIDPIGSPESYLFPRPSDDSWTDLDGNRHSTLGCGTGDAPDKTECTNKTNATANMRMRIDPEIHISDNLRIMSQIDLLDNLVLGSTPEGYTNGPAGGASGTAAGWASTGRGGYVPLKAFSNTQITPVAGINSLNNSVSVKRVWGEFMTPVGQVRFGRMPSHWGLGVLANAGDYMDADYQSTADRIMFITGIKKYDLYVIGAWDFPASGKTSQTLVDQQGQAYNVSQLENVNQWVLAIARRVRPEEIAKRLARGEVVVNGGLYSVYRQQILGNETTSSSLNLNYPDYSSAYHRNLTRVGAKAFIPDLWIQVLAKNFRWETEAVYIHGSIENPKGVGTGIYQKQDYQIRQFGYATELEYRALNDDLHLRFSHGFASGDGSVDSLVPGNNDLQTQLLGNTVSTFRFSPAYRVDLILFRQILSRVQGAYYFKPGIEYDFSRSLDGEKFGGRAEVIWTRASKPIQTPGHQADLGVEIDLTLYYQSKDGSLNDNPSKLGGFYAMLQYGVLFPLGGLGYLPNDKDPTSSANAKPEISTAQTVRLFLGIAY